MLQKMYETPSRSKCTVRDVPASYSPRSNFFPLNSENTLWNQGSRLGKSTVDPLVTARRCGSNDLFFWRSTAWVGCAKTASLPDGTTRVSHTNDEGLVADVPPYAVT